MGQNKIKIGITGQAGFVGTHLYNFLGLQEGVERILFQDEYFKDAEKLQKFVDQCDAIVHLAAMNRHGDPQVIYDTNVKLVNQLIETCESISKKVHILFSSSTQEERDNLYGKSKKEGRKLLSNWAERTDNKFTGFIIPNVFGPYGHPYYNSVVATFCHQLTHNETPKIEVDGEIKLIYVNNLVKEIHEHIVAMSQEKKEIAIIDEVKIDHNATIKVSELLNKLTSFKEMYFDNGMFPSLNNEFDIQLFNTFLCYIDHKTFFPYHLKLNIDERGSFVETVKLNSGGQVSFSTTKPGITRGNHFHTRKAERFAVIKGKARIDLRKIGTSEILSFNLDGDSPSFVDMPIWYTHNITNIGDEELYTIFWINEFYNPNDTDTFYEEV